MADDFLNDMSDEELEAAFREAKAQEESPDTEIESVVDEDLGQDTDEFEDPDESDQEEDLEEGSEQLEEDQDSDLIEGDADEEEAPEETAPVTAEDNSAEEAESKPTEPVVHKFKANGKEYEITEDEMKSQFPRIFGQAMDYTKKMQTIAPWRKTIDAIEQAKLSHEDINLAIDVLKGNKEAIAEVLKRTGVETLDIDTDNANYVATDYGRDAKTLAIRDVLAEIESDKEFSVTHSILSSEWDEASWNVLADDPEKIRLLHADVKSGMYARLQPKAEKMKLFDGGKHSDLDYYMAAAREFFGEQDKQNAQIREQQRIEQERAELEKEKARIQAIRSQENKRASAVKESDKRKAAKPSAAATGKSGVVDYLNGSDEEFEEWYKRLEESL